MIQNHRLTGVRTIPLTDSSGNHGGWLVECPGCGYGHLFDDRWTFNGNQERPTFSPSMLVNAGMPGATRCHSFVRDGRFEFLSDCDHELAGKTVEIAEVA